MATQTGRPRRPSLRLVSRGRHI